VGGFTFPGRSKLSDFPARLSGALFLAFFPLVFLTRYLVRRFELVEQVDTYIVYWVLLILCIACGCGVLLRALSRTQPLRRPKVIAPAPAIVPPAPAIAPPNPVSDGDFLPAPKPRKVSRPQPETKNPFDFS
jgi:hypothetical protein